VEAKSDHIAQWIQALCKRVYASWILPRRRPTRTRTRVHAVIIALPRGALTTHPLYRPIARHLILVWWSRISKSCKTFSTFRLAQVNKWESEKVDTDSSDKTTTV
jgi:hypothetical protein